ncbi:MAG TPA: hypothetical protein VGL57_08815 [Solirubrobacteraceae bacterium]
MLAWPLLFSNASMGSDWLLHLWYLWHQSLAIRANHFPSLYLNYSRAVFFPEYAFYGGTLYALAGILSLALGDAPLTAYILTYCIGFAAAYAGWYWMARIVGLGRWEAHAPGFVFITSAAYITIVYGRGDWPEFIGVSMIPLMTAAGLSVLRADRLRIWPALALLGASVLFSGSHNMTLLWGTTFLALIGLAILVLVPQARHMLTRRGVIRIASLLVPAVLVNAWYLLPAIAYESHTIIGSGYLRGSRYWQTMLHNSMHRVSARNLFSFPPVVSTPGYLIFSLPMLAVVWILTSTAILLRIGSRGVWMRVLLIISGVTILMLLVMTHVGIIEALPRPYTILQFSYRLESYVLLGLSGMLLAVLVLVKQSGTPHIKLWTWTLAPVLLVSTVGAIQQLNGVPLTGNRELILSSYLNVQPPGFGQPLLLEDYTTTAVPMMTNTEVIPTTVYFPPSAVNHDQISEVVHLRAGQLVGSNIGGGPEVVHVTGARVVGVDPEGGDVLEILPPANGTSTETISLSRGNSLPVTLGHLLTLIALALLAAELTWLVIRGLIVKRTSRLVGGIR